MQQQLHQVLVDRLAAGLDDEDVGAADRLVVAAVRLAVRERLELDLAELDAELLGDPLREVGVRAAGEDHQPLLRARARSSGRAAARSRPSPRRRGPGSDELSRPAAGLHTPPCSPGAPARPRARPAGTSLVITDPAAIHAPSPTSTGATKPLWIAGPDVAADRRAALRPAGLVREVGGDRAGADVRVLADLGVADVREVRHLRRGPRCVSS